MFHISFIAIHINFSIVLFRYQYKYRLFSMRHVACIMHVCYFGCLQKNQKGSMQNQFNCRTENRKISFFCYFLLARITFVAVLIQVSGVSVLPLLHQPYLSLFVRRCFFSVHILAFFSDLPEHSFFHICKKILHIFPHWNCQMGGWSLQYAKEVMKFKTYFLTCCVIAFIASFQCDASVFLWIQERERKCLLSSVSFSADNWNVIRDAVEINGYCSKALFSFKESFDFLNFSKICDSIC